MKRRKQEEQVPLTTLDKLSMCGVLVFVMVFIFLAGEFISGLEADYIWDHVSSRKFPACCKTVVEVHTHELITSGCISPCETHTSTRCKP